MVYEKAHIGIATSPHEKWTVFSFKIFVYDFVTSPDNESSSRLSGVIEALS